MAILPVRDLVLVRHCKSLWNKAFEQSRKNGDNSLLKSLANTDPKHEDDSPLCGYGETQAKQLGKWLRNNCFPQIDYCFTSCKCRAIETARLLGYDVELKALQELNERSWGTLLYLTKKQEESPRYRTILSQRHEMPFTWKPPGGETLHDGQVRAMNLLSKIGELPVNKSCFCIGHGEQNTLICQKIEGQTDEEYKAAWCHRSIHEAIPNGSVVWYTRKPPCLRKADQHALWKGYAWPCDPSNDNVQWSWERIEQS